MSDHKIYEMPFADVFPHYVAKIERKGRTISELYCVLEWLTGYTEDMLQEVIGKKISFREFFDGTPTLNSKRNSITGVICGVRIENIEEDLMLFKKTKDPQDIDFNTFNSKKYPMFESIQNIYVENKEQTERYLIEY